MADRAELGVVDLDDDAGVEQGGIGEGRLDRADGLQGHAHLGGHVDPFRRREAGVGRRHLRVVVGQHDELAVVRTDAGGVLAGGLGRAGVEGVALRHAEGEGRVGHPVLDPVAVGAPEVALAATRVHDPAQEAVGGRVLGLLPGPGRGGEHALEHRGLDPLAPSRSPASEQGGADAGGGEEGGAQAGPARPGEQRPLPLGPVGAPRWDVEVGQLDGQVAQLADGGAQPAPLVPVDAGTGGDESVHRRAVALGHVAPVGGDGAQHQPRVAGLQAVPVEAEAGGHAGGEALDHHVGPVDELRGAAGARRRRRGRPRRCACPGATPGTR